MSEPSKLGVPDTCAVLVERIGPYHLARLSALAQRVRTVAIETFGIDKTYAWDRIRGPANFERYTLLDRAEPERREQRDLTARVTEVLAKIRPAVVAIPGWWEKSGLAALNWCLQSGTPAVVLSASFDGDDQRPQWKEAIKQRVVRLFSAGMGGGTPQARYLAALGLPRERVFSGCDVVDNHYFAEQAEAARREAASLRAALELPERFFLSVCRFIQEKNLLRLIQAYAAYRKTGGTRAWKFVLLGDGPLREALTEERRRLGLEQDLLMPGFKQYDELPAYYALAGAFVLSSVSETWGLVVNEAMAAGLPVLVSNRCGCAMDLVTEGRNGFTFDPNHIFRLAELFSRVSGGGCDIDAMGRASREIIERWSPATFAATLPDAVEAAHAAPKRRVCILDRVLLWTLLHR